MKEMECLKFIEMGYHWYDPRGITTQPCTKLKYSQMYASISWEKEEKVKNCYSATKEIEVGKEAGPSKVTSFLDD